ncbi:hypothetical protein ADMFC3_09530 [Geovibrio sp. ADMFC3]
MPLTLDRLKEIMNEAISMLWERDVYLFEHDVHEQAIAHRLALYLENVTEFDGYNIDCEYNKDMNDPKRSQGEVVRPDIIVHRRGSNEHNLVVIELKKAGIRANDAEKVRGYVKDKRLAYKYGVYFAFPVGKGTTLGGLFNGLQYYHDGGD